jgi:hypothetical protein
MADKKNSGRSGAAEAELQLRIDSLEKEVASLRARLTSLEELLLPSSSSARGRSHPAGVEPFDGSEFNDSEPTKA